MTDRDDSGLIDQLCDEFEEQIREGIQPIMREFLDRVRERSRDDLLRELLALESELLPADQWQRRLEQHQQEFPECSEVLDLYRIGGKATIDREPERVARKESTRKIGPYKILQVIGEGGMGSVYMAQQEKPFRRRVAVKVIRAGTNSRQVIARFEAERQALALMEHPSIARILDAGTTESGEPYFAMELVKGISLSDYCDKHRLDVRQRIEIFIGICDAVQHAHQKGIIHRDLKPNNILVGDYNGQPVAKIIDFGLAKALEFSSRLTDKTLFTEYGQVVGTVNYMSPEQAGLDALDVDTRSDIYTLGVILYELLTGTTPLDSETVRDQPLFKVLETIREQETVRPSARVSSKKYSLEEVTKRRSMDSKQFLNVLSGDLDWIVVKALEKERNRRYQTAGELSKDLRDYLVDEPVTARPPSKGYLLTKFLRRHKVLTGAVITTGLILLVATAICLVLIVNLNEQRNEAVIANQALSTANRQIESERDRAEDLLITAQKARAKADQQRAIADEQRVKAEEQEKLATTVLDFFQTNLLRQTSVYEQANDGDPNFVNAELTLLEALQKSATEFSPENIEKKFPGQPETQANILETMAEIFSVVDEHDTAIKFSLAAEEIRMAQTEGSIPGEVLANRVCRVFFYLNADQHADAAVTAAGIFKETHDILKDVQGKTLTEKQNRDVDDQVDWVIDAIATRCTPKFIQLPQLTIEQLNPIDYARIIGAVTESLLYVPKLHKLMADRFQPDDVRAKYALLMTGFVDHFAAEVQGRVPLPSQTAAGSLDSAIETYEDVLKFCHETFPPNDLRTAGMEMVLAVAYRDKFGARDDRVLRCYQEAARICHQQLPSEHPANILVDGHVARHLTYKLRFKEATELYRAVVERRKRVYGTEEYSTTNSILNLAKCYRDIAIRESDEAAKLTQLDAAIKYYREAYEFRFSQYGSIHDNTAQAAEELAKTLLLRNDPLQAVTYFQRAWETRKDQLDGDFEGSVKTLSALCDAQVECEDRSGSIENLKNLLGLREGQKDSEKDPLIPFTKWRLAQVYIADGQIEKAKELLNELGQSEVYPFQMVIDESDSSNASAARSEAVRIPHTVVDIDANIKKNACQLRMLYEFRKMPEFTYVWYRGSTESEFAQISKNLEAKSHRLIKKKTYQLKGKNLIAHLWHREKTDAAAATIPTSSIPRK